MVGSRARSGAAQPAHAADRLPCRWLKGSPLAAGLAMKYTGRRLHSRLPHYGFSVVAGLHGSLARHGGRLMRNR
jgi:hypothetical protein